MHRLQTRLLIKIPLMGPYEKDPKFQTQGTWTASGWYNTLEPLSKNPEPKQPSLAAGPEHLLSMSFTPEARSWQTTGRSCIKAPAHGEERGMDDMNHMNLTSTDTPPKN